MWHYWKRTLRPLKPDERDYLYKTITSPYEVTGRIIRAKALLALADGEPVAKVVCESMRMLSEEDVFRLIAKFNREGLNALNRSALGDERSPFSLKALFRKFRTAWRLSPTNPRTIRTIRQNATRKSNSFRAKMGLLLSSLMITMIQSPRRIAASLLTNLLETIGRIRSAIAPVVKGAQSKTVSFVKTSPGLVAAIALIALMGFSIWRFTRPNPFDPGYVALQPVVQPTSPDIAITPIEGSLPSTQFANSVPDYIPVVRASVDAVRGSTARIEVKNVSNRPITFSFRSAETGQFYSVDVQPSEEKTFSVPSGTYQDFSPPITNQGGTIRHPSGSINRYELYVESRPQAPGLRDTPYPLDLQPVIPPELPDLDIRLEPRSDP